MERGVAGVTTEKAEAKCSHSLEFSRVREASSKLAKLACVVWEGKMTALAN